MKRIFPLALAGLLALALSACSPGLSELERAPRQSMTLDLGDGIGPRPYDGGLLPERKDGEPRWYTFELNYGPPEGGFETWPALVVGPSAYPYRLYLNDRLVRRYGQEKDPDRTRLFTPLMVDLSEEDLGASNTVRVEAFVTIERTPLMDLGLVDARTASSYVFWRTFFMSQLVAGGFVIGLLLFVYFLFIFLINKGKEIRFLWFALLCGFFSLAYVNIVFNHLAASDTLLTKIGRFGFLFCATAMSFYVMEATGYLAQRRWIKAVAIAAATLGTAYVAVQRGFNATNDAFHLVIQLVITPNLVLCIALLVIAVIKKGFRSYAPLCLGFAGVIATSLYDMGYETAGLIPYAWTLAYGYEWLVISIFMELAIKQERVSRTSLKQSVDLNRKNSIIQRVFTHIRSDAEALAVSSEELAVSTREISSTGSQQAVAVREIVSTMEEANGLLGRISGQSTLVREDATATAERAEEGARDVKEALEKLEAVISKISESISLIADFNEHLGSIKDIVRLIEGVATQIRIIAFNASLEAVAAGEAGKNFGIVAEEVKRLSDSTMASIKGIRERVGSLIKMSDNVVSVAREGYASLEQSWDIASGMRDSFAGIAETADSSARATAEIDASLREESRAFEQILQTLKEISGGVNNFVDSANQTTETTRRLNDIAERLHNLIIQNSGETTRLVDVEEL